jgi:hypothetical protein
VKFNLKISKRVVFQLMLFAALAGIAVIFDVYLENHPGTLEELTTESQEPQAEHGTIYLFSQIGNFSAKSMAQKIPTRKLFDQAHDKLLQKCHQLRNHQALKTETKTIQKPLYLSYHHLIFRYNYFTLPDDEPFNS